MIIPTYNREKTIKRSIESVLNQTYRNIEVIVIDDCSKDNTQAIISELDDKRILYFKNKENLGACASRNYGIEMSQGEYIAFQDSDDEWLPEKLELQINYLKEENCDVVFCSMTRSFSENQELYPPYKPDNDKSYYKQLLLENCISTQTVLGKRNVFKTMKFDTGMPRFQDWELMLRLSRHYNLRFLDRVLVNSYIQENSISVNSDAAVIALKEIYSIYLETIQSDRDINAQINKKIAEYMLASGNNPKSYYKKSFQESFKMKNFLFYLICSLNLHKQLYNTKSKYINYKLRQKH
ncbi:glycosyltransferase [Aquibacillus halophilus]|uniref:glycosyltransferase n=1 Tax=Aquibacillus halophilus TaxID=930132 RepID=UPI00196B4751